MVAVTQNLAREDFGVDSQRKGKATNSVPYCNVARRAHWIDGISEIVLKLVKVQLA